MEVNEREIYRYLGFGNTLPDERTKNMVKESLSELLKVCRPHFFSRTCPLKLTGDKDIDFSWFQAESLTLHKNLQGCERVILFAATLGTEVDRLIRRYSKLEVSRAVIVQAAGAALIEAYCDGENERLRKEYLKEGCYLRPRFSPGYGDFSLSVQKDLLRALEAEKRVGITLTDNYLIIPSKSVTAVIGVGRDKTDCEKHGCEACQKADCQYRRIESRGQ